MCDDHDTVAGNDRWKKFILRGRNATLSTVKDIIPTNELMTHRTVGVQVGIASSNNTDDKAGQAGARTVKLTMLDENYLEVVETLTLNGQTEVKTAAVNIIAINDMEVMTTGANGVPTGNIDAGADGDAFTSGSITTAANFMGTIIAGKNRTEFAGYTVPDKTHVFVKSILGSAFDATATVKYATLDLCYLETGGGVWQYYPLIQTSSATGARAYVGNNGKKPLYFPPKSAFRIRGICSAAAVVTAEIEGVLITLRAFS